MRTIKGVERRCVRVDIRAITELSIRVQFSVKAQVAKKDSAWTEMVCASSLVVQLRVGRRQHARSAD